MARMGALARQRMALGEREGPDAEAARRDVEEAIRDTGTHLEALNRRPEDRSADHRHETERRIRHLRAAAANQLEAGMEQAAHRILCEAEELAWHAKQANCEPTGR